MANYNQPIKGLKTDFVQKSIDIVANIYKIFTKLVLFRHFAAYIVYLAS